LVKPPAHGAKLIAATPHGEKFGAQVVKQGDMVAVLHERPHVADEALKLVKAHSIRRRHRSTTRRFSTIC